MKARKQLFIALFVIMAGVVAAMIIVQMPPQADQQPQVAEPPVVQTITVQPQRLQMTVQTRGRVKAQTEIEVITGVSGNITHVAPAFVSGGFFKKGDLLVSIDPAEYDLRVAQAQARMMEAQYQLTREEAEAGQARQEWRQLGEGDPSPLNLRIPQLKEKKAKLAAEQEELKNARLLRQRTEIRAPFNGRVRSKTIGIGQYLNIGDVLGRIYSSDLAEVRLPVNTQELSWVDVPDWPARSAAAKGAEVILSANYHGELQTWRGWIVRGEGAIDEKTGMVMIVAQVSDPFGLRGNEQDRAVTMLPVGLYVEASIAGRWLEGVYVLPASALLKDDRIAVVDQDSRLRLRHVAVLKKEREQVILKESLMPGERIMVSGILHPLEGMSVVAKERP
ncbi:MAG: efflux RND transporter periplasmic adaptor subunit [Nitrosomonas sp.]|uniref:efflux RND transporter periplasmic adaptor subunit n=1 Tax=Nitrosomonas sp. TaxID=42353 RepID=UPI0032EB0DCE